jgi:glutamyl-Q tRNA(Asp) synthetase
MAYVGRFAPAPTGPLHFGSVVTALASWLRARQANGRWLVRIEDLDTVRAVPGAESAILVALERLGLHADGEVVRQSDRDAIYREALARMEAESRCYPCACSRREIGGGRYPGTCRGGVPAGREAVSRRLDVAGRSVTVIDAVLGELTEDLDANLGDFVVQRGDGLIAYHLAVVVDDALQGITEVVRGADIWPATPRQVELQRTLDLPTPDYLHVPVAVGPDGRKLSKQNAAPAIDPFPPGQVLCDALAFLGLDVHTPATAPPEAILAEGRERWSLAMLPRVAAQDAPSRYVGEG